MHNNNRSPGSIIFNVLNYTFFALFTLICLYPFYYVFIYSISEPILAGRGITFLPRGFTLNNYYEVFREADILEATFVSLSRTVIGTALTVICSSFFAYLMTKQKMYFRKIIYRFMVITMYVSAGLIPYFLTMRAYGLNNSFFIYIIPGAVGAFNVILIKTYMESLPASLEEAAIIDGAGIFRVFSSIMFPLSKPIIATITVFAAVGHWNSWFDNLIFMVGRPELNTLQFILYDLLSRAQVNPNTINMTTAEQLATRTTPDSVRTTITMIVTFPILFVYPFAQKFFVKGIMIGAIKG